MLKEIILAIIIGALLGVGVMGGYLSLDKRNTKKEETTIVSPTPIIESTINTSSEEQSSLSINSLENYDIVSKSDLEVSGTTTPKSTVIITLGDQILDDQSDEKGNFKFDVELESGLNIIKITSIDNQDNQVEKTLNITYSTAEI